MLIGTSEPSPEPMANPEDSVCVEEIGFEAGIPMLFSIGSLAVKSLFRRVICINAQRRL